MSEPSDPSKLNRNQSGQPFLWGVATSAYQSEGGMNGDSPLRTNWAVAEEAGKVEPVGKAAEFWLHYKQDFKACNEIGLNAFRLGLSWTRLQPTSSFTDSVDESAAAGYADMVASCRDAGLEPIVTLQHFTHPEWLGTDVWLEPEVPTYFARFVEAALFSINNKLADDYSQPPIHWLITINEPNMLVLNTYMGSQFPSGHGMRGFGNANRAFNGLLRGHVRAYGAIHKLYRKQNWPRPLVTFNNYCSDLYWSDKIMLDLVATKERGIKRSELHGYICDKADALGDAFREAGLEMHRDIPYWCGRIFKAVSNWLGRRTFSPGQFAPLLDELEHSEHDSFMDYIGLDYYDPFMAHLFRFPRFGDNVLHTPGIREWMMNTVTSKWWDWRVLPRGLDIFCDYYSREFGGRQVLIAENGMALQRDFDNLIHERVDGMTRSRFLRLHVHEVLRILDKGIPLVGYLHWSLFDNYEWGSYTPRFGLFSLDYTKGTNRLKEDFNGDNPSATYRDLIIAARRRYK